MSRVSYVNGRYVPHRAAMVHIEDRGYQFADGVYEVFAVLGGRLVEEEGHLARLDRSLSELMIAAPASRATLRAIIAEVVRRNRVVDGMVYLQVTRGVAPREHAFPAAARSSLVITARNLRPVPPALRQRGIGVITLPEIRWQRRDIKSVALLPNVLGKERAKRAGAYEAWFVEADGTVTEGSSTNAWIVAGPDGKLLTHPPASAILNGITRRSVLDLARDRGMPVEERRFTLAEALAAREAFITSTTAYVLPVVRIDGAPVGDGVPGPLSRALVAHYADYLVRLARDR